MRDRTDEFNQKTLDKVSESKTSRARAVYQAIAVPVILENEVTLFIKNYLKKVEELYDMFSVLDEKIKEATDMQSAILEFSETDERLYVFYDSIKKGFLKIAEMINELDNSLDVREFYGSDTELRICKTQLLILRKKLSCSVCDYYNIQEEYKEKCRDRVKRQAQIIGADVSKVDFDTAVENKTDIFLNAVFPDYNITHHYMQQIKKRHEDLLRLEKSLVELRDLIFDLNLILKFDYNLLSRIDKHIQVVNRVVVNAGRHIKKYKGSLRTQKVKTYVTWCCCIVIIVLVAIAIITSIG